MSVFNEEHFDEGLVSELSLFTIPSTQTGVSDVYYEEVRPLSQVTGDGPLEFRINGQNSMDYLDLKNSQIYVRLKITKSDGTAIGDLTTNKVGPSNLFLQSLFSSTEVTLQNKTSITCNYNPYRAYIQTLLKYGQDAKSSQIESQLWMMDDADSPGVADPNSTNNGLYERAKMTTESKVIDMQGPIFHDLFSMSRYILNQVDVKVKMYRSSINFCLLSGDVAPDYAIDIEDIYILVKKVRVNPAVIYGHSKVLEKQNALYPFTRVECRAQSIATGSTSFNWENMFQGRRPEKIILGFVKSKAVNGDYGTNPFNFEHCRIQNIGVYADGQPVGGNPLKLDFEATGGTSIMRAYTNLLMTEGKWREDQGNALDRDHYISGSTLFAFQLEPDFSHHGEFLALVKTGNIRLDVQFRKPLTGCDISMTAESGVIRSPGYGLGSYPDILTCTWIIKPASDKSVSLTFTDFETEANMDVLEIYEGTDARGDVMHSGVGFSGVNLPNKLISTEGFYLRFQTSAVNNYRGFSAKFYAGCPLLDTSLAVDPPSASFHSPDVVTVTCAEGYLFSGSYKGETSFNLTCQTDGSWNVENTPICERQYCGFAPTIENGHVTNASGVRGADTIVYACNDGFVLVGDMSVTCLSSSAWGRLPECTAPLCTDLVTMVSRATFDILRGDGQQHASIVNVTCNAYYELIGPETITCEQGIWLTDIPQCQQIQCHLNAIPNAVVDTPLSIVLNSIILVQCNPGYAMNADPAQMQGTFRCGVDEALECLNINECELQLDDCENSECTDTDGGYSCSCLPGFVALTSASVCEDVDECTPSLNLCDQLCTNTQGSYVCSCEAGYELYKSAGFNDLELYDGETGNAPWHTFYVDHSCVLKICIADYVLNITNGKVLTSKHAFFYGDIIGAICDIGFFPIGTTTANMTTHCGIDGQWSQRPICEVAYCNENYGSTVTPSGNIRYGDKYMLTCTRTNGQILVLERVCGYDKISGTYKTAGDELVCPETDCGVVPVYTGMKAFVTPSTLYNSTIMFECEGQYIRQGTSPLGFIGHNLVRCNEDGVWDFGTLRCEGGQCSDPGYPVNGYTTLSSWQHGQYTSYSVAIGTVATFSCNIAGYVPEPTATATCVKIGDTATGWDNDVPICEDREAPTFLDCPGDIHVDSYSPVYYAEPTARDNTAVKTLVISPENFQSGMVTDSASSVIFIATDPNGNSKWCLFGVLINDKTPPKMYCDIPPIITPTANSLQINTNIFVNTDDPYADISSFPNIITSNYETIGTNPVLEFIGKDNAQNHATCHSQVKIEAPKCTPDTLRVYNGDIDCTASQLGYSCSITCMQGNYFYENASLTHISVTCQYGGDWSRAMPICTASDLAYFRYSILFQYVRLANVDEGCGIVYEKYIMDQSIELTNSFTTLCADVSPSALFDVSPSPNDPISADIVKLAGKLEAQLTIDMTPQGLPDDEYLLCSEKIFQSFNKVTSSVDSIKSLPGDENCPEMTMETFSASEDSSDFVCSTNAMAAILSSNAHICLACPPGTFTASGRCVSCAAGSYNDNFYATSCTPCPTETDSRKIGAMYQRDCYDDCAMHLVSSNGKAPCADCPADTFWRNSTYCESCPQNTHTKRTGAIASTECKDNCRSGQFSQDGLEPCNQCPRNYYQAVTGTTSCTECLTHEVTLNSGSNSSIDCLDGYSQQCASNPCLHSGVCSVIRHTYFCTCTEGEFKCNGACYTGRYCQIPVTPCDVGPCLNGGTCQTLSLTAYNCTCPGTTNNFNVTFECGVVWGPCDVGPCLNGGTCQTLSLTAYNCTCPDQFSGYICDVDANDCDGVDCSNNGTCIDQKGSYICACAAHSGFYGDDCESPQDPCIRFPCNNSGICVRQGSYNRVCNCPSGFSGLDCEIDRDECDPSPCMNDAVCINGDNEFTCDCPYGYTGTYCHLRDESDTCSVGACSTGVGCVDNYIPNSKYCICVDGWHYAELNRVCTKNIGYCDNLDCGANGECITYDGGYHVKCRCNSGYGGDTCQLNVDDCAYQPCKNDAVCEDGVNAFTCSCHVTGTGGTTCEDNDNGCLLCVQNNTDNCTDHIDRYTCYCMDGFEGHNCEIEIASCSSSPCQHGGTCTSHVSLDSAECSCTHSWSGPVCEVETDNCVTGLECMNTGQCISTSGGYVCNCAYGYTGTKCEERYDLCARSNPCTGGNNKCDDTVSGILCDCQQGYTGHSCETLLWQCADDTCKHGGACAIQENIGVVCTCIPGYSGDDCSIDTDECQTTSCTSNSHCVDAINGATCVCTEGNVGEDCQKESSSNFDYIVLPSNGCPEEANHGGYSLHTSSYTLVFWMRIVVLNEPETIVTLYGVQESETTMYNWEYRVRVGGTGVRFDRSHGSYSTMLPIEDNDGIGDVEDGLWHHMAVSWSSLNGYLTLYLDGLYNNEVVFAEGQTLSPRGYLVLGSESSSENNPFIGRISKLDLYNEKLEDNDIFNIYTDAHPFPTYSVISQDVNISPLLKRSESLVLNEQTVKESFKSIHTVSYNSQLYNHVCTGVAQCPDKPFTATTFPSVLTCPNDTLNVGERITKPEWDYASFSQTNTETRTSTAVSGEQVYGWGLSAIGITEYSVNGNAAVCTFRLYSKRMGCSDNPVPDGMSVQCMDHDEIDGSTCEISCNQNNYSPSEEIPRYYTCSKYGMWDEADKVVDFIYSSCAPSSSPMKYLNIQLTYEVISDCESQKASLVTNLTDSIVQMNTDWSFHFCTLGTGGSDPHCASVDVMVECTGANTASVEIVFPNIKDNVGPSNLTEAPEDAAKISIKDRNMFNFEPDAVLSFASLVVAIYNSCPPGNQLIGNECVQCGNGFYYDSDTAKCTRCPKGTYRTVNPSTNVLSGCTPCTGSDTTSSTGSPAEGNCHVSCFWGNFYNESSYNCEACTPGFYSDVIGSSYCFPCDITQTTVDSGEFNPDKCIPITIQQITESTTDTVGIGASTAGGGLSVGTIAAIVMSILIVIVCVAIVVFLYVTKRLPCFAEEKKIVPVGSPYKHVYRYGETNMKYVNYRLSDIRDSKQKSLDKIPIYPEPRSADDIARMRDDIAVHVPVFLEKLNGKVNRKRTFISIGRASEAGSDLDHTLPVSEKAYAVMSDSGGYTSTVKENGRSIPEFSTGVSFVATPPSTHRRPGSSRRGRPPTDLSPAGTLEHPMKLAPIRNHHQVPDMPHTSEYIRPLPTFSRQRPDVSPYQYQDFLENRPPRVKEVTTPTTSQMGSDKILLDSEEEDLR